MQDTFTDSKNRVACPASLQFGDLINSGTLHFTTPAQIAKYGLCRKCRKRMKEHHKAILAGKLETPVDLNEQHHAPTVEQDHVALDHGELTQSTDFDFDEVDRALGLVEAAPPDARQQAGELVREIFEFCFKARGKKFSASELKTAAMRFAIVVSGLRPDILNDATHGELAKRLSRTKAAASKASVKFEDKHGFQFARSRSLQAREAMRVARLAQGGVPRNKRAKVAIPAEQPTTTEGGG